MLSNRCRDLLDIGPFSWDGTPDGKKPNDQVPWKALRGEAVDFIHRTAKDFLNDSYLPELPDFAGAEFNPHVSLLALHFASISMIISGTSFEFELPSSFFRYVRRVDSYLAECLDVSLRTSYNDSKLVTAASGRLDKVGSKSALLSALKDYVIVVDAIGGLPRLMRYLGERGSVHAVFDRLDEILQGDMRSAFKGPVIVASEESQSIMALFSPDELRQILLESSWSSVFLAAVHRFPLYLSQLVKQRLSEEQICSPPFRTMLSKLLLLALSPWTMYTRSPNQSTRLHDKRESLQDYLAKNGDRVVRFRKGSEGEGQLGFVVELEVVKALLDLGADPNQPLPPFGLSAWTNHLLCHYQGTACGSKRRFPKAGEYFHNKSRVAELLLKGGAEAKPLLRADFKKRLGKSPQPPHDLLADIYGPRVAAYLRTSRFCPAKPMGERRPYVLARLFSGLNMEMGRGLLRGIAKTLRSEYQPVELHFRF
ncbi:hypothetical protein BJ508DRAFT_76957 [Ascobolus immersus RN42]|uniref:Uncharacterized protein n=1 Tax=Ascobolus immersus RN42 TaxID=1160509 RepID=A0A3N4HD42_ASCIM|nr:hypothetical protein BJ508DRAFT_76957 [Ascobolus immersus RN42]